MLTNVLEVLKKCHKLIKTCQRGQDDISSPLTTTEMLFFSIDLEGTHVLVFDQLDMEQSRMRTFLCKLINGNLCVLHDLYNPLFDSSSKTPLHQYEFSLLHAASCMLRDCFRGSTFPYQVVRWLATKLSSLEHVILGNVFHDNGTWLLHEDDNHWTTLEMNKIVLQDGDHFDSLLTCISVD